MAKSRRIRRNEISRRTVLHDRYLSNDVLKGLLRPWSHPLSRGVPQVPPTIERPFKRASARYKSRGNARMLAPAQFQALKLGTEVKNEIGTDVAYKTRICAERSARKQVLFALNRSGAGNRRPKFNEKSKVRCK